MDGRLLEKVYQENLEERLISYISEKAGISLEDAMTLYYNSRLADMIQRGSTGIQYLDHKVLGDMLLELRQSE